MRKSTGCALLSVIRVDLGFSTVTKRDGFSSNLDIAAIILEKCISFEHKQPYNQSPSLPPVGTKRHVSGKLLPESRPAAHPLTLTPGRHLQTKGTTAKVRRESKSHGTLEFS